ncbi:hypothetical protein [Rhizobium laguerreae]|uniref:hypothetical protein n=1 Tax=Rhizobium laguerreae TaxID=1076926 RepID=UPI00197D037D|nr:hypothetical protein [Rhizobium laguerreae]
MSTGCCFLFARRPEEKAIATLSDQIGQEREKKPQIQSLGRQIGQKELSVKGLEADRDKLIVKGSEARADRLTIIANATEEVRSHVRFFDNQESSFSDRANRRCSNLPVASSI